MQRSSGILMPISSLPSKYGIGTLGKEAYAFADMLVKAKQKYWQILPLAVTSYGDSPYQSFSTYAGNPYFIDLEILIEEGLLTAEECDAVDFGGHPEYVDYGKMYEGRYPLLRKAFENDMKTRESDEYREFCLKNSKWLEDYALFMALKTHFGGKAWTEWDEDIKLRKPKAMYHYWSLLIDDVNFQIYIQFKFYQQWGKLKAYCNELGIDMIGDMPIYVSADSADTWANGDLFMFDERMNPTLVAGCPPDAFSATGQLWGNPIYRWETHRQQGYAWWIDRVKGALELYDMVRIDHFRGFDEYWAIPAGDDTAMNGKWMKGPGIELFNAINAVVGKAPIIAEDLGYITASVKQLLADSGYPGMKLLQFAFDSREASDYLPHGYPNNCVVYTGTHDNDTLVGWYTSGLNAEDKALAQEYLHLPVDGKAEDMAWEFIRAAFMSVADLAMVPMHDYLELGSEARINFPSTVGSNWKWRMKKDAFTDELAAKVARFTELYDRCERPKVEERQSMSDPEPETEEKTEA